jgi:hypothetical protein
MTDAQLTANRANAQLSTGPRTDAGKRRSSLNSFRHGLTGQIFVATPEETEVFQRHCAAILQALDPAGPIESYLAQAIAEGMWRLQRARALENGIFANGHRDHVDQINAGHPEVDTALAQSRTWTEQAHNLHLLTVYEQRINRAVEKNTAQLKALQTERKAVAERAREEATLFVKLAESKGEIYEPALDFSPASAWGGFVFSSHEIARRRERASRLSEACELGPRPAPRAHLSQVPPPLRALSPAS